MSSILTNNGAMVALQTLRGINKSMASTQNSISTGKDVSNAKDNAAVWAISKVMESDVAGFKAINDNLGLGQATTAVARQAAETTTDLLKQMKEKIVASQEQNVDRTKIQADIEALRDQIASVTGAAQFNGLNLLSNTETVAGSGSVDVLSSLDRSGTGVAATDITVRKQDLGSTESSINTNTSVGFATRGDGLAFFSNAAATTTNADMQRTLNGATAGGAASSATIYFGAAADTEIKAGTGFVLQLTAAAAATQVGGSTTLRTATTAGNQQIIYVARDGDTAADVARGLAEAFNDWIDNVDNGTETIDFAALGVGAEADGASLSFTGAQGAGVTAANGRFSINIRQYNPDDTTIGGGLEELADIDVTTDEGARRALRDVEGLIQRSIDAAASFGSAEGRIETQQNFVSGLMDALKSGIGTLVDADMEEQSARLQALQVQQQLGVQALSIANQAPQQLLSLFR